MFSSALISQSVSHSVCLSVHLSVYSLFVVRRIMQKQLDRFSQNSVKKVARGPGKKSIDFGVNLGLLLPVR